MEESTPNELKSYLKAMMRPEPDVIHNSTTRHYSLVDRVKILFGGISTTDIEIRTKNKVVYVTETVAKTSVSYPRWAKWLINRFQKPVLGEAFEN